MDKKIIVNLIGGLGNQFFQYAAGYALSLRTKMPLYLDVSGFKNYSTRSFALDNFNVELNFANEDDYKDLKRKHFFKKTLYKEKEQRFYPQILKIKNSAYLKGFWQSEKYFCDHKEDILKAFTFKNTDFIKNQNIPDEIKKSPSVSINLRLCEYVSDPEVSKKHFVCSKKYYQNAINYIAERVLGAKFFVFSDDLEAAKSFLPDGDFNYIKTADWREDLYFMQNCTHNIVANSSFSWWAAWLNQNKHKIVLAPNKWYADKTCYRDVVPESWIKIPV